MDGLCGGNESLRAMNIKSQEMLEKARFDIKMLKRVVKAQKERLDDCKKASDAPHDGWPPLAIEMTSQRDAYRRLLREAEVELAKQRAHNDELTRANKALLERLDSVRVCHFNAVEQARWSAFLDGLRTKECAAWKRCEDVLREFMSYGTVKDDAEIDIPDAVLTPDEAAAFGETTIETEDRFGGCVEPNDKTEPAPPRPRLFTTAEKDAYVAESATKYSGQKLFPNEVSRGWWTIARNGVPVTEPPGAIRPRVFSNEELYGYGKPSRVIMEGDPLPWEQKEGGE